VRLSVDSTGNDTDDAAEDDPEDETVVVNASLAAATRLFPLDLSDSIKRIPDPKSENNLVAAISMTFPEPPVLDKQGCHMSLEVTSDKIQYLAQEIFGRRLETNAGLRYVCFADGGKILPNPNLTLKGCRRSIHQNIFGFKVSHAITTSPGYQDEAKQWRQCTDCVSMVISAEADLGAFIYLSLGVYEGIQIKKELFQRV
jgi:hypothetical protein